jgi:replicative DNA helicase
MTDWHDLPDDALTAAMREAEDRAERERQTELTHLGHAVTQALSDPPITGLEFPSPSFIIERLQPGCVTFLGGYPGDGKSALAHQWMVAHPERRFALFSYEMPAKLVGRRCAQVIGGNDWRAVDPHHFDNFKHYIGTQRDDMETITRRHGPFDAVIIDHLHLLAFEDRRTIEQWCVRIKDWAIADEIPILVLGQLRNDPEFRMPHANSFRETGMIHATADLEMYVWRERDSNGLPLERTAVNVAKDRLNGNVRIEWIEWDGEHVSFRPLLPRVVHEDYTDAESEWRQVEEDFGF